MLNREGDGRNVSNATALGIWEPVTRDIPALELPATNGSLKLSEFCAERAVLYVYPATGVPERDPAIDPAPGWDDVPGAAGCTPQSLGFNRTFEEFTRQGIRIAGVSTQPLTEQQDFARRHQLSFPLASDEALEMQRALSLPTFELAGRVFLKRLVLYIERHRIERVISNITAPADSARQMLELLAK